jgi:hypothetical protein
MMQQNMLIKWMAIFCFIQANSALSTALIMAHSKTESLASILTYLQGYATSNLRVIITQSCENEQDPIVASMTTFLDSWKNNSNKKSSFDFHIEHILTPYLVDNGIISYNPKRNSLNNLRSGLEYAFSTTTNSIKGYSLPSSVIILEDDVQLSPDTLSYFSYVENVMDIDRSIDFATTYSVVRPSIIVGLDDMNFMNKLRHYWYDDYSIAKSVDRIVGSPRIVFKTFAWMISARGYRAIRIGLNGLASYVPVNKLQDSATAASAAETASMKTKEKMNRVKKLGNGYLPPRSGHVELAGCLWCNDYCYDHFIEWILQGAPFLAPAIPRATQRFSNISGMSNDMSVNNIYDNVPILTNEFQLYNLPHITLRFFSNIGFSQIAPLADDYLHYSEIVDRSSKKITNINSIYSFFMMLLHGPMRVVHYIAGKLQVGVDTLLLLLTEPLIKGILVILLGAFIVTAIIFARTAKSKSKQLIRTLSGKNWDRVKTD